MTIIPAVTIHTEPDANAAGASPPNLTVPSTTTAAAATTGRRRAAEVRTSDVPDHQPLARAASAALKPDLAPAVAPPAPAAGLPPGAELILNASKRPAPGALQASGPADDDDDDDDEDGGDEDDDDDDEDDDGGDEYEDDEGEEGEYDEDEEEDDGEEAINGGGGYSRALAPVPDSEEVLASKREVLYQFDRLARKGAKLPRTFNMSSDLTDMRNELERVQRERAMDASVRFQRRALVTCVTGLEMLNNYFDPVGARLKGWSESVSDSITDYDDVFEELFLKYRAKTAMPPEMKLMMMLGTSAFQFHLANTLFKGTDRPDVEEVLRSNPELMRQFAAATAQKMAADNPAGPAGMFANMFQATAPHPPQPSVAPHSRPHGPPPSGPPFGGFSGVHNPPTQQRAPPPPPAPHQQQATMRGPSFDHLMPDLEALDNDRIETLSTVTDPTELPDNASVNGRPARAARGGGRAGGRRSIVV
jgi:hypothetical protein